MGPSGAHFGSKFGSTEAVFEIALVRDKWLFTRTSKQSVSSYPSDKWKFTTIFYFSLSFYYNAVIERQNARDFTLENRQRSRCYLMSQKQHGFNLFDTSVICWIIVVRTLQCALDLALYYWWRRRNLLDLCAMGPHLLASKLMKEKRKVGKPTNEN